MNQITEMPRAFSSLMNATVILTVLMGGVAELQRRLARLKGAAQRCQCMVDTRTVLTWLAIAPAGLTPCAQASCAEATCPESAGARALEWRQKNGGEHFRRDEGAKKGSFARAMAI
jgi:hypothetical protein